MIDVSNLVVKACKDALADEFPDVKVYSSYVDETEQLPAVTCYEVSNSIDMTTMDSSGAEHYANVVFEISCYAKNDGYGRQATKKMFTRINDMLVRLNFVRTFKSELPNMDRSVYRYSGRFEARVSEDMVVGERTITNVYRR